MAEELRVLFSDLKPLVAVNDQDTLADLEDKILAEAGRKEGKNLAKSQVGAQELNALDRLAGEFYEGQKARNLLLEMNELTALHKSGYKGGRVTVHRRSQPNEHAITHPFSSQGGCSRSNSYRCKCTYIWRPWSSYTRRRICWWTYC